MFLILLGPAAPAQDMFFLTVMAEAQKCKLSPDCYGSVGWSTVRQTEKLWVQFPVRAHTQVVVSIPDQGMYEKATNQCFSLTSMSISLPYSLSKGNGKMSLGEDKKMQT